MRQILITLLLLLVEATAIQYNNTISLRRYEMTISAYSCNLNIQDFESTLSNFLNATSDNIHIETTCKMESTINMDTYMPDYYFSWLIEYRNNFDQNESETKLTNSSLLDQFSNEAAYENIEGTLVVHDGIPYISSRNTLDDSNNTEIECVENSSYVSRSYLSAGPIGSMKLLSRAFDSSLDGVYVDLSLSL